MHHLLVTNDFPPKLGGIQSYLYELWRRLPPGEITVLTTAHPDAQVWDQQQAFPVVRVREKFLSPTPGMINRINEVACEIDADLVVLDPAWPLGAIGPHLERPYGVVLHGAEVTIPARLPFVQLVLRRTLRQAALVVAAGTYPAEQGRFVAGRVLDQQVVVPPGVDGVRFHPLDATDRAEARHHFGIAEDEIVVLGLSRLVARKGFDVLIDAAARLRADAPKLKVIIAGEGRDRSRLEGLAVALDAPVRLLGRVEEDELPSLYGCADIFAMLCRDRWLGLEQEGFGIVFLEAAATGIAAVAGASGGSAEAVVAGQTGLVVDDPSSVDEVVAALAPVVHDRALRRRLGAAARERAIRSFSYDALAHDLQEAIARIVRTLQAEGAAEQAGASSAPAATPGLGTPSRPGDPLAAPVPPDVIDLVSHRAGVDSALLGRGAPVDVRGDLFDWSGPEPSSRRRSLR